MTLPAGWEEHQTEDGSAYFFNPDTAQSVWSLEELAETDLQNQKNSQTVGASVEPSTESEGPPAPWETHTTEDGQAYFFNPETEQSAWTLEEIANGTA